MNSMLAKGKDKLNFALLCLNEKHFFYNFQKEDFPDKFFKYLKKVLISSTTQNQ